MKLKQILVVMLALILALNCSVTVFAAGAFIDVAEDAYYADAVDWAEEKEITNGRGNGIFDPEATVNRAEAVTFLWRMAGRPEPTQTETFTDVEADPNNWWYQTAVQWAVENGITNGTGGGKFSPTVTCSRGMILTMLYRMEGEPFEEAMKAVIPENPEDWTVEDISNAMIQSIVEGLRSENGFTDVKQNEYYELPIFWAAVNGILNENQIDMEARTVRPAAPCPRGEMVWFLYRASGDAPAEGAIEVGTIPETVVLDQGGVKVTVNDIKVEGFGDVVLSLTVVNGSEKLLSVDAGSFFVNTYSASPQVYVPVEDENGWTFYADVVVAPGETKDCYLLLNSLDDKNIDTVRELELQMVLNEVVESEYGYDYVADFAVGDMVNIRTSLFEEGISYDQEGALIYDKDGLKVLAVKAENDEYSGPQIAVYAYNNSSEDVSLEMGELKLDGENVEAYLSMDVPVGKRSVETVYITYDGDIPVAKEAELTLRTLDQETWEPKVTFDSVKITFTK